MKKFLSLLTVLATAGCFSACSSGTTNAGTGGDTSTTGLQLASEADFSSSASALATRLAGLVKATTTATCASLGDDPDQDEPQLSDGLDCDGDDGIVAHITPTEYSLAVKSVTLVPADVEEEDAAAIEFVPDTGTLAASEVIDFTQEDASETLVTIDPADLTAGTYSGIEVELYYFQMTMPVAGVTQRVRIYMSDDDFEAEGSLGHHQGDITFINEDGTEAGWVDPTWLSENVSSSRTADQNGAGNDNETNGDSQTGHERGFFGNADFWDDEAQQQGADQDIYVMSLEFDEPLVIPDPDTIDSLTTITVTFSTADTFFYEDFAPQDTEEFPGFFPADGGEAASEDAAWAPLAPDATITVTEGS